MLVASTLAEYAVIRPHPLAEVSTAKAPQASATRRRRTGISINVPGNWGLASAVT
jgi:hypothetical protein